MRVKDSLEYLSESTRQAILHEQTKRYQIAEEQDLTARLLDPVFIGKAWEQADELERTVIRLFVTKATRGFFSKRTWERETAKEHRHLSVGLTKLRRLGLILTVRKMWSEIGYLMPQEVREQLTNQMLPEASQAFVSLSKTLPYYISAGRGIQLDLFGLLLFVRDNHIPITQKGSIHRRMSQKMLPLLSFTDEHVKGIVIPPLDQEQREGLSLTVVLDIALRLGLVYREERELVLDLHRTKQWLHQPPLVRWEELYQLVMEQFLPHGDWWEFFIQLMKQVPVEQWCSIHEQLRMLKEVGFPLPDNAEELIVEQWLHILLGMGWIQLGMDEERGIFWRWSSLPRLSSEEGWFVDPTGAITIPPLVPLLDVWEISQFCQLQFDGQLIRGELQARLLQAYLAQGGTEEQVIEKLRASCVHPLPESLVEVVSQWARTARQIQMEPYFLVRTAHAGFLEEWREIPDFRPFLTQIVTPTTFLIPFSQEKELIRLLRQFGYEPQVLSHIASASKELQPLPNSHTGNKGLLLIERPWDGYAIENTFPEQNEQIAALPKMWTKHFQSYHPQSMRDLFKRAIELKLEVEIQQGGKDKLRGLPTEVRLEMGYWMVTIAGQGGKQCYRLDSIERVRIVVPEYLY
ncbi:MULTISPECIES: hypothetical protein [unclassified Brevibacillus]|uniref:hypothetical protein n=1 Tax=unclassified Brevibacillus TaxID=2684853 RepID=UPI00156AA5C6|nr:MULTISPECIES: hypothetical protein [unclassified Brevibacillus]NRR03276.1 hypothetical protein [Brevibacillus sp. RS1.1]NRS47340.1 hypothetical protein [Brevibacillus sp. HB2.2]